MTTTNTGSVQSSNEADPAPNGTAQPRSAAAPKPAAEKPYSPGLEGVIAAETAIGFVDGANGRLLYRGYPIGQLVEKGTYGQVAELLWTGEWRKSARLVPAEVPEPVMCVLRELPDHTHPMDALRTAVSVWGTWRRPHWPPTVDQARELTAFAPSALAAFHRLQQECVGLIRRDREKRRDRRQQIGCNRFHHRHQGGALGEARKFLVVGTKYGLSHLLTNYREGCGITWSSCKNRVARRLVRRTIRSVC